jgi:hypothetical protein
MSTPIQSVLVSAVVLGQHLYRGRNVMSIRLTKAQGRKVTVYGRASAPASCLAHVRTGDSVTMELLPSADGSMPNIVPGSVNVKGGRKNHRRI